MTHHEAARPINLEYLSEAVRINPFAKGGGSRQDHTSVYRNGEVVDVTTSRKSPVHVAFLHEQFRSLILAPHFPCVGAKMAVARNCYEVGVYGALGDKEDVQHICEDLFDFIISRLHSDDFASFVSVFTGPQIPTEIDFERLLWAQLQNMHFEDRVYHDWDPTVSSSPSSAQFSFSFGGTAFFVVGMGPQASRWSRRFGWPTLVFNSHEQFEKLRARGVMSRIKTAVRERDAAVQGNNNPTLADFGEASEALQYSGRDLASSSWRCPFSAELYERIP